MRLESEQASVSYLKLNKMSKRCKYCDEQVYGSTHYCEEKERTFRSSSDDFLISAAIGYVTNSSILGGILGGDIAGGIVGDLLGGGGLFD